MAALPHYFAIISRQNLITDSNIALGRRYKKPGKTGWQKNLAQVLLG